MCSFKENNINIYVYYRKFKIKLGLISLKLTKKYINK